MRGEEREATHPVKNQSRDLEFLGGFSGPIETFIGDDATGRRVVIEKILLQRVLELIESSVEVSDEVSGRDDVEILAARWEPDFVGGEGDFYEVDFRAGGPGPIDSAGKPGGVMWGGDYACYDAVLG